MLAPDGSLDRAALAAIVFSDPQRRQALEAIVHPLVGERSAALLAAAAPDAVVVYDVPLLAESLGTGRDRTGEFDAVVVVEAPEELRVERLVARGLSEPDARARIAAQATDAQRREIADHILDNSADLDHLTAQVEALWHTLRAPDPPGRQPGPDMRRDRRRRRPARRRRAGEEPTARSAGDAAAQRPGTLSDPRRTVGAWPALSPTCSARSPRSR